MPAQLAALQHWMREVVTHPDGVVAGASTNRARSQFATTPEWFDEIVTPSATLTSQQRLEIYQHGYFRRLLDCLGDMLPVLRHALGSELFEHFALDYLHTNPSRSYTLARLDDGFVTHLRSTRPDAELPAAEREDWPDFIIDLATLEHDIRVTFDGPGVEGEPVLDRATVDGWTDDHLLTTALEPVPCLSWATFRFPVRSYLLAVREGADPALPAPCDTHVVFNRRDFGVRLVEFDRTPFDLLAHLAAGRDLATAGHDAGIADIDVLRSWLLRFAEAALFRKPPDHQHACATGASQGEHR